MATKKAAKTTKKISKKTVKKTTKNTVKKESKVQKEAHLKEGHDVEKQSHLSSKVSENKNNKNNILIGIIVVLIILVVGVLVYTLMNSNTNSGENLNTIDKNTSLNSNVIALVNSKEITSQDFDFMKKTIEQTGQQINQSQIVEILVNQELLFQESKKNGFEISAQEAGQRLDFLLSQQGLDKATFEQQIISVGFTMDSYLEGMRKQIAISDYRESLKEDIVISEEDSLKFYEENQALIAQGNQNITYDMVSNDVKGYLKEYEVEKKLSQIITKLKEESSVEIYI